MMIHALKRILPTIAAFAIFMILSGMGGEVHAKPVPLILPEQTPITIHNLDKNHVVVARLPDGTVAYNVFEVAMQAMEGRDAFWLFDKGIVKKGLLPRMAHPNGMNDPAYQMPAYEWLEKNARPVKDALIWYYRFDNAYNDVKIKAPWPSAFGQAHVVKAFLHAWQVTGKRKYRDYAIRALRAYRLTLEEGGFQSRLPDGGVFFEEVPTAQPTHILNGHMISTIVLLEAGRALHLDWAEKLGQAGVRTLVRHLADYDMGYWSRYDMNPKKSEIVFRLVPRRKSSSGLMWIDKVSLLNARTGEATVLDVGAGDDAEGAWRISGIEWGQAERKAGRSARRIFNGPSRHCAPVRGGSIQNSYLILQLPTLKFGDVANVPEFYLRIDYLDAAPGSVDVQIQDINHGNFLYFNTLTNGTIETSGDGRWKTAFIVVRSKDLAWYMGEDYQKYHVKLLEKLDRLTGEPIFGVYARRWSEYLKAYTRENGEAALSTKSGCQQTRIQRSGDNGKTSSGAAKEVAVVKHRDMHGDQSRRSRELPHAFIRKLKDVWNCGDSWRENGGGGAMCRGNEGHDSSSRS